MTPRPLGLEQISEAGEHGHDRQIVDLHDPPRLPELMPGRVRVAQVAEEEEGPVQPTHLADSAGHQIGVSAVVQGLKGAGAHGGVEAHAEVARHRVQLCAAPAGEEEGAAPSRQAERGGAPNGRRRAQNEEPRPRAKPHVDNPRRRPWLEVKTPSGSYFSLTSRHSFHCGYMARNVCAGNRASLAR